MPSREGKSSRTTQWSASLHARSATSAEHASPRFTPTTEVGSHAGRAFDNATTNRILRCKHLARYPTPTRQAPEIVSLRLQDEIDVADAGRIARRHVHAHELD